MLVALGRYQVRRSRLSSAGPIKRKKIDRRLLVMQLAEPDLLQLKSLAPLEPTVHYLLGKLYKSLGPSKRSQMLAAFTTAQDLEPRMAA